MKINELISQDEYHKYLNNSIVIIPYRIVILFTPLIFILIFTELETFNLLNIVSHLFISIFAILLLLIFIVLDQKNSVYRNQNSIVRDCNNNIDNNVSINDFTDKYDFYIPTSHRYISDALPGILYFTSDKVTFVANRVIGLKLVWFNLNKLVKGYYDLNFLPNSFDSTYKIVELPFLLRFIYKYPTKLLIINEKRLNIKKRYIFKIPTTQKIEKELRNLSFIS